MGSSVSSSKDARLQPVWRKGMTMTRGPVSTTRLLDCKKLTPLISRLVTYIAMRPSAALPRWSYGSPLLGRMSQRAAWRSRRTTASTKT